MLEHEEFRLLRQIGQNREAIKDAQSSLEEMNAEITSKEEELSKVSAMFLLGGKKTEADMVVHKADGTKVHRKRVVQPLGRREAVLGTQRILERRFQQLQRQRTVVEQNFGKIRTKNQKIKDRVDSLRREQVTYDKLIAGVTESLGKAKRDIELNRKRVKEAYDARDHCRQEAQSIIEQMQEDRADAELDFQRISKVITQADQLDAHSLTGSTNSGYARDLREEFDAESEKLVHLQEKLRATNEQVEDFQAALDHIRDGTGYSDLQKVERQLSSLEEEKFAKVTATSQAMSEIEALEKDVGQLSREMEEGEKLDGVGASPQLQRVDVTEAKAVQRDALKAKVEDAVARLREQERINANSVRELDMLMPALEKLHHALQCDEMVEPSNRGSFRVGSPDTMVRGVPTPTRTRVSTPSGGHRPGTASSSSSWGNVIHPPTLTGDMSIYNITDHMAVMEQRTTELLQQYAILLMYDPQTAEDDESLHTKARLSSTIAAATGEPSPLGDDATTSPRSSAGRSQLQLGPSAPPGSLACSLASSALLTSLLDDVISATGQEGQDDDLRPLSRAEMNTRAKDSLHTPQFRSAQVASRDTAKSLLRVQKASTLH